MLNLLNQTEEFATRMRRMLVEKIPMLSSRMYRILGEEDGHETGEQVQAPLDDIDSAWRWEDAENRLRTAYDKDGLSGRAEAVLKELEVEA